MEKYPRKFTHIREPYGTLHLEKCRVEEHVGSNRYTIEGLVQEGVTKAFFGGCCGHVRDETGTRHVIYDVTKQELEQGYKRSIAM